MSAQFCDQLSDVALGGGSVHLEVGGERFDEITRGASTLEELFHEEHSGAVESEDAGAFQVQNDTGAVVEGLAQTEVRSQCRGDVF